MTQTIIIFLLALFFTYHIYWIVLEFEFYGNSYFLVTIIGIIFGIVVAYICSLSKLFRLFVLGVFFGYLIISILYNLSEIQIKAIFEYQIKVVLSIFSGFICILLKNRVIIYLSSISGGFIVSFFISYLFNFVQNPMDQKERKLSGAYLGAGYYFAVFASIGISSLGIYF